MSTRLTKKNESGFTLIEMAIVILVIGLLTGGILKGQELVENARITSTAMRVRPIEVALATFRSAYNAYPGDMTNPQVRLKNCQGDCANIHGNGDGHMSSYIRGRDGYYASYNNTDEGQLLWYQLAGADLIEGLDSTGTDGGLRQREWDVTAPGIPIRNAGFKAFTLGMGGPNEWGGIHGIALGVTPVYQSANVYLMEQDNYSMTFTMHQAQQLDSKLDNGFPITGRVQAVTYSTFLPAIANNVYNENMFGDTAATNMIIRVGE